MIVGTGLDLVEISRVAALLRRHGSRGLERLFTWNEIRYCRAQARPELHYAARFAAKEAVLKVLGTGWSHGIGWLDVEVTRTEGKPGVALSGEAARIAKKLKVRRIHLSLTHTDSWAAAQAVGER
jgi:holo-[acyl-carrier protein] synthase